MYWYYFQTALALSKCVFNQNASFFSEVQCIGLTGADAAARSCMSWKHSWCYGSSPHPKCSHLHKRLQSKDSTFSWRYVIRMMARRQHVSKQPPLTIKLWILLDCVCCGSSCRVLSIHIDHGISWACLFRASCELISFQSVENGGSGIKQNDEVGRAYALVHLHPAAGICLPVSAAFKNWDQHNFSPCLRKRSDEWRNKGENWDRI